jgi:hypothetical protein
MKAKLIKQNGIGIQTIDGIDYYLILDGKTYHTNPLTSDLSNGGKLSKQNCDEIFGVVDVEKLAEKEYELQLEEFEDSTEMFPTNNAELLKLGFIEGFNKAMELNKDNVFTVEDMEKVILNAIEFTDFQKDQVRKGNYYHIALDIIQSLQQPTEIDVEIVTETREWIKKLDSDGCLMLKKIETYE